LTDMVGGGPFRLPAGHRTDDTSMALCLAESLIERRGFDARDQMARYVNWWKWGYLSSTGECFDIGRTTHAALARFERSGEPLSGSPDPNQAGNGSLMRLAPVVMFYFPDRAKVLLYAEQSSATTHAAPEALDCCRLLAATLCNAFDGHPLARLTDGTDTVTELASVRAIARGEYKDKRRDAVRGTGYCVASLEASLWCLWSTGTFEDAILAAANLGDDADTTAAITGQLAGAYYGFEDIPATWRHRLHLPDDIVGYADRSTNWPPPRAWSRTGERVRECERSAIRGFDTV
jgi:ADP-ribosyl-[dinitrogen reductase] hydrolase